MPVFQFFNYGTWRVCKRLLLMCQVGIVPLRNWHAPKRVALETDNQKLFAPVKRCSLEMLAIELVIGGL